ncbi:hypothetical protein Kpho02_69770 [Kitasatospora phosalacinea]|uniref:Uncharacterized protein n=1 Tax=Kitasatospora phosalacinea TaxID=2065 RepID=A0A9W6QGM5_9ACTN|nr:hypothetical protein [Kitasatospora phosalacinea]GLW74679.1 hypothetical protein Kpho02_69770 [Kitasatospora phosalacinea]
MGEAREGEKTALWRRASELALRSDSVAWRWCVRRAAELVEPYYSPDTGPYDSHGGYGLESLALLLFVRKQGARPTADALADVRPLITDKAQVERLLAEQIVSGNDEALSDLATRLMREHVPLPDMFEVPAALTDYPGVPLHWGLDWLERAFRKPTPVLSG